MLESIVSYGLAVGAVYALIGITYNVMFSASRVFSFTAGMLGMLGGVLGALFIGEWGLPVIVGLVLVLACGAVLGTVTEIVTVRPVLKSIEQHLYVLSTLAFALMIQQLTAIEWGTDARPFPRLIPIESGWLDQRFWLPMLACAVTIVGLELLYRRTLVGRAWRPDVDGPSLVAVRADGLYDISRVFPTMRDLAEARAARGSYPRCPQRPARWSSAAPRPGISGLG